MILTNTFKYTVLIFIFLYSIPSLAQSTLSNYWVNLTDKKETTYNLFYPQEFLSPRALERRKRLHIPIDSTDLPVNKSYQKILSEKGGKIRHSSKWLNAVTLIANDSVVQLMNALPFVKSIHRVGRFHDRLPVELNTRAVLEETYEKTSSYYGYGSLQIGLVNGHALHRLGYTGEGVYIGVQDGGFDNVDVMPFFDSLRVHHRLLEGKDFVDGDNYIYESATHGTSVLSVMAGNLPHLFVGTAPEATYLCMKTEDVRSETLTEECNWVAALEYADSMGIDVINSSLGYTTFSEEPMNYNYSDLNGQTSRASIAAEIAYDKGIFIVNSAGNSGANAWRFVGTPADSRGVFAVGAVTSAKSRARFSSFGPTADGRIKPNISAMGQQVAVASSSSYDLQSSSGTSVAAPIIAGLVASMRVAFPDRSNQELGLAIEQSASQAITPDNVLGYGIPDFYEAYRYLKGTSNRRHQSLETFVSSNGVEVVFLVPFESSAVLYLYDWSQNLLLTQKVSPKKQFEQIQLEYNLPKGVYYLSLLVEDQVQRSFFIK